WLVGCAQSELNLFHCTKGTSPIGTVIGAGAAGLTTTCVTNFARYAERPQIGTKSGLHPSVVADVESTCAAAAPASAAASARPPRGSGIVVFSAGPPGWGAARAAPPLPPLDHGVAARELSARGEVHGDRLRVRVEVGHGLVHVE